MTLDKIFGLYTLGFLLVTILIGIAELAFGLPSQWIGWIFMALSLGIYVFIGIIIGAYTIPDFLGARYGGNLARIIGVLAAIACSFTYLIAQVTGAGLIVARFTGMLVGLLLTAFYMIGSRFYGLSWFGTQTIASAIFGLPAGFLTIWIVSLLTPAPPAHLQELVLSVRYPKSGQAVKSDPLGRDSSASAS
jgi:Na+(H+)/acetate symporter ActP